MLWLGKNMLPIYVQETEGGFDFFSLLLPIMACCMLTTMLRRPSGGASQETQTDEWYVTTGIQETYDTIIKEVDQWRENAANRKSKGLLSNLSRKKTSPFNIITEEPPRLFRVDDDEVGETTFELTDIDENNTYVKVTYEAKLRSLLQDFKVKLPLTMKTAPKVCPSCGKETMPDFKVCPYCETKLR